MTPKEKALAKSGGSCLHVASNYQRPVKNARKNIPIAEMSETPQHS